MHVETRCRGIEIEIRIQVGSRDEEDEGQEGVAREEKVVESSGVKL